MTKFFALSVTCFLLSWCSILTASATTGLMEQGAYGAFVVSLLAAVVALWKSLRASMVRIATEREECDKKIAEMQNSNERDRERYFKRLEDLREQQLKEAQEQANRIAVAKDWDHLLQLNSELAMDLLAKREEKKGAGT